MSTLSKVALDIAGFLRAEQLDFSNIISKERQEALDLIEKKELKVVDNKFKISTQSFFNRLKELVRYPYLINQGGFGLCTTASFVYVILKDYPTLFVKFAFELLATGKGSIGQLKINTSNDFRNVDFEKVKAADYALNRKDSNEIDYLFLGAIRDSKNKLFDIEFNENELNFENFDLDNFSYALYDYKFIKFLLWVLPGIDIHDVTSDAYSGINEDLIDFFNATNLYKPCIFQKADKTSPETILDKACKANETVILDILTGGNPFALLDISTNKGGHNCVMYSNKLTFTSNSKNVMFHVQTWGQIAGVSHSIEDFKKAFKGHLELNRK